jgi:hypothetical protein
MSIKRSSKEFIRHLVTRSGFVRLYVRIRRARGQNVDHLFHESLAERFSAIYNNRIWLTGRKTGALSGIGSEIENTVGIRRQLPELLASIRTQVLLDVGCGDLTWMKEIDLPCKYIGADVVPSVIAVNSAQYGSESRRFCMLDATRDSLPPADTVLCREVLFHLSFQDIWRLLENVRACGASLLIATNDSGLRVNADIISGDSRTLNLQRYPFHFPQPVFSILDNSIAQDRVLSVWEVQSLPRNGRSGHDTHRPAELANAKPLHAR